MSQPPIRTGPGTHKAVLERNLERFPWSTLSDDKGEQLALELLMPGASPKAWRVILTDADRLPGPFDQDLYVALGQLYNAAGMPENRTVETTAAHLAELMHRPWGGGWYEALKASLRRLAGIRIEAEHVWREQKVEKPKDWMVTHVLEAAGIRRRGDLGTEDFSSVRVWARLSEEVSAAIAAGHFRTLDTAQYFALSSPTARRLYRYLDRIAYRGQQRMTELRQPLKQIADELPIQRSSPSHIKRTLDRAHEELIAHGFIQEALYEEKSVKGRKRPDIVVHYVGIAAESNSETESSSGEPSTPLVSQAPKHDEEYTREKVAEILDLLKDEHSTAFYVKVVRTLHPDQLEGAIGYAREMVQTDGVSLESARKMFTRTVQARAVAAGLEL